MRAIGVPTGEPGMYRNVSKLRTAMVETLPMLIGYLPCVHPAAKSGSATTGGIWKPTPSWKLVVIDPGRDTPSNASPTRTGANGSSVAAAATNSKSIRYTPGCKVKVVVGRAAVTAPAVLLKTVLVKTRSAPVFIMVIFASDPGTKI